MAAKPAQLGIVAHLETIGLFSDLLQQACNPHPERNRSSHYCNTDTSGTALSDAGSYVVSTKAMAAHGSAEQRWVVHHQGERDRIVDDKLCG